MTDSSNAVYQVRYGKGFLKDLKKIMKGGDKSIKKRVKEIVEELKIEPHKKRPNVDIKLISPREEGVYRVRIGKYRMLYEIDEGKKIISITMIFSRGKGY